MREAAYTALVTQLMQLHASHGGAFQLVDRRLQTLDDVAGVLMPALFVTVEKQTVAVKAGQPPRRTLRASLFVYVESADAKIASGIQLNNLLDAIEARLAPTGPFAAQQTLGGVVAHAWIDGTIEIYEALKTQRAAALVPVTMLLP